MSIHLLMNDVIQSSQQKFEWGTICWLANGAIGNTDDVTLGRTVINPGCSNPRHLHSKTDEVLYLLSGSIDHTIGHETVKLNAGDSICIPAGIFHNAICTSDVPADMIVAFSGERDFIEETV